MDDRKTDKPEQGVDEQARAYFLEQASHWRRQGDVAYAQACERRAAEWSRG